MSVSDTALTDPDVLPEQSKSDDESGASTEDASEEPASLPLDQQFEILKNERRRTVLRYLADHDGPVALGDLAEHVAAVENDTTVPQVTSRERKCVYVGLYQCHLPKMDDMDIVQFNRNRGRVELGPNAAQLEQYLEESDTAERPWPVYYGAVALVGLVLIGVAAVAGSSLAVGISAVTSLSIAAVAVAHALSASDRLSPGSWLAETSLF